MTSKAAGTKQGKTGMTVLELALIAGIVAVFMVAVLDLLPIIGEAT